MKREIVKTLPKIELHCHLDGSVRPHILEQLAQSQNKPISATGPELAAKLIAPEECQSLLEYLERFDIVLPYLQTTAALELVAYDLIAQVAEENVAYIEVRFAPMLFVKGGLSISEIVDAILAGLKRGETDFGVKSNALLCAMRHHSPERNQEVIECAKEFLSRGVAGFDLAGDEAGYPTDLFAELISLGTAHQIPVTLHAGECGCPQNVAESIKLGATRIGHGIAIQKDPTVLQSCLDNQTLVEMCPTSNFQTKAVLNLADYPFKAFLDAGLNLCINTDNRTVSNTTLTDEYMKLHQWYGISYDTMEALNHNAVDGAFISDQAKRNLHKQLTIDYANL